VYAAHWTRCLLLACSLCSVVAVSVRAEEGNGLEPNRLLLQRLGRFRRDANERNDREMVSAFRDVVRDARPSTVRIFAQHNPVALGTVVTRDGHILTKASEVTEDLVCVTSAGVRMPAKLVAQDREHDLALLKVDSQQLVPISWSNHSPRVGAWLVTPGIGAQPEAIGVVSAASRSLPPSRAVLGVNLEHTDIGPRIKEIVPDSAAGRAALEIGDVVLRLNGKLVRSPDALREGIGEYRPGERVELVVRRGLKDQSISVLLGEWASLGNEQAAIMESLGGALSTRRSGFPVVLQHDSIIDPHECGGPVVDLDGRAVGINIARASRVASYAIPASAIREVLARFQTQLIAQGQTATLYNASAE
jgi:serine protease Do